ncbi:MAG: hypothetical protein KBD21_01210 [Candidatus Pacebacteria bacterium]|nr:hypothetical protein [Candidatus Paceibacterota bacterium]
MGKFKKESKFSGPKRFGHSTAETSVGGGKPYSDRSGRSGYGEDRPLYQATCTECQKRCEVPFQPAYGKPVFCRDCFRPKNAARTDTVSNDRARRPDHRTPMRMESVPQRAHVDTEYLKHLDALNQKLDKILTLLMTKQTLGNEVEVRTPVVQTITEVPEKGKKSSVGQSFKGAKKVASDTREVAGTANMKKSVVQKASAAKRVSSRPVTKSVVKKTTSKVVVKKTVAKKSSTKK